MFLETDGETLVDGWWTDIEEEVLTCLRGNGVMSPAEVGRRLGVSEDSAVSLLSILARRGKIRICLVQLPTDRDHSTSEDRLVAG